MEIEVTASSGGIQFGATGVEQVIQNVRTILSTIVGTCPLYREFGHDPSPLDQPMPIAEALTTARLYEEIEKYESRVEVVSISYSRDDLNGKLLPVVRVRLKEGVTL